MKRFFFALGVLALPVMGQAQVVVHQAALDQLAGVAPPVVVAPVVTHKVLHKPVARSRLVVKRVVLMPVPVQGGPLKVFPGPLVGKSQILPTPVPVVAKQAPVAPFVPTPPKAPPVKVAVAKPAPALPALPGAVVLRFGDGVADLPGGTAAALQPVCKAGAQGNVVAIDAYAPADANDPSAAMRLSMSRAFAVRDALTACGVPSTQIFARADGAAGDVTTAKITLARGAQN